MVPSHWSIDSGCDYWSSVHSPQKPCDVLQILLPCFLQAVNSDWSLKLKTIIVTLSFTSAPWVPLSFYFWGLRSGLQYIFSSLCSTVLIAFICLFLFFFFNDLMAECSPFNINPESNIKVITKEEMTTN